MKGKVDLKLQVFGKNWLIWKNRTIFVEFSKRQVESISIITIHTLAKFRGEKEIFAEIRRNLVIYCFTGIRQDQIRSSSKKAIQFELHMLDK